MRLLPIAGIGVFIILYIVAASLYPGGSDANRQATSFSWRYNYWCELMASESLNGAVNTARTVAITAMIVLAASVSLCWYYAAELFAGKNKGRLLIMFPGILSMALLFLLFTGEHDMVISIAGFLGIIAMLATMVAIYLHRHYALFGLGIVCMLLCILNNYLYYIGDFIGLQPHLALIQKITFIFFLAWFAWLCYWMYIRKTVAPGQTIHAGFKI
jgi:hypothetical protein